MFPDEQTHGDPFLIVHVLVYLEGLTRKQKSAWDTELLQPLKPYQSLRKALLPKVDCKPALMSSLHC